MPKTHSSHRPRKRFGQHFLRDEGIIASIIGSLALEPEDFVIEIGPGLGALTALLVQKLNALHVVELDRDLVLELPNRLKHPLNLCIHAADALQFDFAELQIKEGQGRPCKMVGNLPYNISTPLILSLLKQKINSLFWVFMLQAEVAKRLVAEPGSKDYGRLTIMVRYFAQVDWLLDVPKEVFYPVPQVESAVVRFRPFEVLPIKAKDYHRFESIVQNAFMKRRKTLSNALKGVVSPEVLEQAGISPGLRPEQLSVADYVRLSNGGSDDKGRST